MLSVFILNEAYELIGIGHPVLGFGASSLVERFVEQLPDCNGTPAFVFKTASSPHYINNGASNTILRSLREKGYTPFHNSIVAMPCNFYLKYDDRLNKQLYQAAQRKVELFAEDRERDSTGFANSSNIGKIAENGILLGGPSRWKVLR